MREVPIHRIRAIMHSITATNLTIGGTFNSLCLAGVYFFISLPLLAPSLSTLAPSHKGTCPGKYVLYGGTSTAINQWCASYPIVCALLAHVGFSLLFSSPAFSLCNSLSELDIDFF
jgi:hypothetical protein